MKEVQQFLTTLQAFRITGKESTYLVLDVGLDGIRRLDLEGNGFAGAGEVLAKQRG